MYLQRGCLPLSKFAHTTFFLDAQNSLNIFFLYFYMVITTSSSKPCIYIFKKLNFRCIQLQRWSEIIGTTTKNGIVLVVTSNVKLF